MDLVASRTRTGTTNRPVRYPSELDHCRCDDVFQVMVVPPGPANSQCPVMVRPSAEIVERLVPTPTPGLLHLGFKRAIRQTAKSERVGHQTAGDRKPSAVHLKNRASL